ncbi:hypothetical protein GPALN_007783 [Globodera pallida]|nr:hypothetical protein GPALN_007783 [Globodera pallida]
MVALCQKFGRLLIGAEARFFARTDITNFSTSLNQSPAPKRRILARLPSGYKGPNAFALFIKDQLRGKTGGVSEMVKIASTNWKSLDEDEKQNYSERAKKIGAELRDNFKKLTSEEKQDLWVEHIVKKAKRRRFRMKKKLRKFYAETNRPKHPSRSYMPDANGKSIDCGHEFFVAHRAHVQTQLQELAPDPSGAECEEEEALALEPPQVEEEALVLEPPQVEEEALVLEPALPSSTSVSRRLPRPMY